METYGDIAVRLDLVNPEAVLHQGACSAEQLLQLPQSERPHLNKTTALINKLHTLKALHDEENIYCAKKY